MSDGSSASDQSIPAWVWWALALAAGIAVVIVLLVRSRRAGTWSTDLATASDEVRWFSRELLPQLEMVSSPAQVAGGWAVGKARVVAAEDRLTALEATAPGDTERLRATALRDAVRQARSDVENLTALSSSMALSQQLAGVAARLEAALGPPQTT